MKPNAPVWVEVTDNYEQAAREAEARKIQEESDRKVREAQEAAAKAARDAATKKEREIAQALLKTAGERMERELAERAKRDAQLDRSLTMNPPTEPELATDAVAGKCVKCRKPVLLGVDGACKNCHSEICFDCWITGGRQCPQCGQFDRYAT